MFHKSLKSITFAIVIAFTLPSLPLSLIEVLADHHHDFSLQTRHRSDSDADDRGQSRGRLPCCL